MSYGIVRGMSVPLTPSHAEYRLIVEHSPVMIWRSTVDASCDYFNDTWLAFTGRTLAQEVGNGWADGVHPEDLQRCVSHYLDHFHRRVPFEMEYRLRRHDGVYRWIFDRGVPFTDEHGRFAGFIGSCVDVDERRKAQDAQKAHASEQLALARDFEKWILAVVSHDIRNPLSVIQLATLQLQKAGAAAQAQKQIDAIARSTKRIQHIVADLLDLSRERAGAGIWLEPKQTDLRAICRQIIDEMQGLVPNCDIALEGDVSGEGVWDEHRIWQAISNLVANALQHGSPGSAVRVRLSGDDQQVAVKVQSDGAIPGELMPHLFEPFRSGRAESKRGDGLGLGLFIAKAIARAHGGDVDVCCSGNVTTFQLVLPRNQSAPPDTRVGALSQQSE